MRYPEYQPTYSPNAYSSYSASVSCSMSFSSTASTSLVTPVGAEAPRMIGGSGNGFTPLSDDDFLDWGDGDGESQTGGTILNPDGDHTAEGVPVGNACWPLLLFICLYALIRTLRGLPKGEEKTPLDPSWPPQGEEYKEGETPNL